MTETESSRVGIKIEGPNKEVQLGFGYKLLLVLSFLFIAFTLYLLILEGTTPSLPAFLKFHIG